MNDFSRDGLTINVEKQGDTANVEWLGESDTRDPGVFLRPYLSDLAGRLTGLNVHLHFEALSYMNSASVNPIMEFLAALSATAVKVVVRYDDTIQWQATSFRAMRVVARRWKNVEVVGGATSSRNPRSGRSPSSISRLPARSSRGKGGRDA